MHQKPMWLAKESPFKTAASKIEYMPQEAKQELILVWQLFFYLFTYFTYGAIRSAYVGCVVGYVIHAAWWCDWGSVHSCAHVFWSSGFWWRLEGVGWVYWLYTSSASPTPPLPPTHSILLWFSSQLTMISLCWTIFFQRRQKNKTKQTTLSCSINPRC